MTQTPSLRFVTEGELSTPASPARAALNAAFADKDGSFILSAPQGTGGLDTGAIADALASCASNGRGRVWLGPGDWSVDPNALSVPARTLFCGAGPATVLSKSGDGVLLDLSGTSEGSMKARAQVRDLRLEGNSYTGALVRSYHAYQSHITDVECYGNNGPALDYAHLWDTYVTNFFAEWCSSSDGTGPSIRIRNSAAGSGFGYTSNSSNELWFRNIRLENFVGSAISVAKGVNNTYDPFGYRFQNLKVETSQHRTDVNFIKVEDVRDVHIWNAILTSIGYQSGQTGAGVGILWAPLGDSSLKQIRMYQDAARWYFGVQNYQGSGGAHIYEAIHGQGTAFGGGLMRWESPNPVVVDAIQVDSGPLESGTRPKRPDAPTITGSRGGNAALASALTQFANLGLVTDSSTT